MKKRAVMFLLATCVVLNTMILPVSAAGGPDAEVESEIVAEESEIEETEIEESETDIDSEEQSEEQSEKDSETENETSEEIDVKDADTTDTEDTSEVDESTVEALDEEILNAPSDVVWNEEKSLTQNMTVNGNLIANKRVKLNGYTLTVNGNMTASAWVEANGGVLNVNGNYVQNHIALDLYSSGTANISGNYSILGDAFLYSGNNSVLNIDGDLIINTSDNWNTAHSGTINLKGGLIDKSGTSFNWKLNLVGTEEQVIDIVPETRLNSIGGTNGKINVKNCICGDLERDFEINSDASSVYISRKLDLKGHKITIHSSVYSDSGIVFGKNGRAVVDGDWIQADYEMNLYDPGVVFTVGGDFRLQDVDSSGEYTMGSGYIYTGWDYEYEGYMAPVITIGGNMVFDSSEYSQYNYGTYNLNGDFIDTVGKTWNGDFYLVGDVSEDRYQSITIPSKGKIHKISLKSCGDFYEIPEGCCDEIEQPDHKYDKGKVTVPTTEKNQGYKTFTCEVCHDSYTEKIPRVQNVFSDVKTGQWFVKAVQYVYENDIMAGSNGKFNPNNNITREQFTQVLYNCEGKPAVKGKSPFPDVADKSGYPRDAIMWANQNNIMNGKADGTFGLGNNITRQDLAVALYKYAQYKG